MPALIPENFETVAPSETDTRLARESSRVLAARPIRAQGSVKLRLGDPSSAEVTVPASAVRLFLQVLTQMSLGNAVTLVPTHAELSTQQAADLLHVSRPYLVKLLEEGRIPSRNVGRYRKVRLDDLVAYQRKDDEARARVIDQLSAEAQELGLGY